MSPTPITPPRLSPGATIALLSPSARLNHIFPSIITRGTQLLTSHGYKVREIYTHPSPSSSSSSSSSSTPPLHHPVTIQQDIHNRLTEIRLAFTDPSITCIICTIGGPSFTELLPYLIADTALQTTIRENPKIVVGYSDITGFHWFLNVVCGLRTFYGPGIIPELGSATDPTLFGGAAAEKGINDMGDSPVRFNLDNMLKIITTPGKEPLGMYLKSKFYVPGNDAFWTQGDGKADIPPAVVENRAEPWTWIREGKGRGRLFGGCLTVMARLGGVLALRPDWRGKIVFLETAHGDDAEKGNPLHRVQAGLADLIAQGVFEGCCGLVVGRAFGYSEGKAREEYMDVIRGVFCEDEGRKEEEFGIGKGLGGFPILFGVDFGHTSPMVTLPYGVEAEMDSERGWFGVVEGAVV